MSRGACGLPCGGGVRRMPSWRTSGCAWPVVPLAVPAIPRRRDGRMRRIAVARASGARSRWAGRRCVRSRTETKRDLKRRRLGVFGLTRSASSSTAAAQCKRLQKFSTRCSGQRTLIGLSAVPRSRYRGRIRLRSIPLSCQFTIRGPKDMAALPSRQVMSSEGPAAGATDTMGSSETGDAWCGKGRSRHWARQGSGCYPCLG